MGRTSLILNTSRLNFRQVNAKNIFVVNCGSSSIKFQILDPATASLRITGIIERIRVPGSKIKYKYYKDGTIAEKKERAIIFRNDVNNDNDGNLYQQAMEEMSKLVHEK